MVHTEDQKKECAKVLRLLAAAKEEASRLKLHTVSHLTQMAIIQLVLDSDGIDPERIPDSTLEKIVDTKTRMTAQGMRDNVVLLQRR